MRERASQTLGGHVERAGGFIRTGPFGSQLHASDYTDDALGVPVVMPKDIIEGRISRSSIKQVPEAVAVRLRKHRLAAGDLVLARRGDVGRLAIVRSDEVGWLCGTGSMRIHAPSRSVNDPSFLGYAMSTPRVLDWLLGQAVGATMPNLNEKILAALPLSVPGIDTQRRIAGVLGAFDELIEINERRIELLEEVARSLYREWFVHFRFPGHEDIEMTESEVGAIPSGWEVHRLSDLARIDKGLSYKGAHLTNQGHPMANLKCLAAHGGFRRAGTKLYSGPFKPRHAVGPGDLVMANTDLTQAGNVIGSPGLVPTRAFEDGGLISHHLFAVRPNKPDADLYFIYHALTHRRFREYARSMASGTTVLGLRADDVAAYQLAIPKVEARGAFQKATAAFQAYTETLLDANERLAAIRDLLLPRLVTGKLDISELDLGVLTPVEEE